MPNGWMPKTRSSAAVSRTSPTRGCSSEGAVPLRVRLLEVTPERIVVKAEDFGDVSRPTERVTLPWPLPAALRAPRPDDPDAYAL